MDRSTDRLITLSSIVISAAFLAAAFASLVPPEAIRHGLWLPLHLALAGGATTAIAGVMPFFVAAFAAAPPADARIRGASVIAVALGAIGVVAGVVAGPSGAGWLTVTGGVAFMVGVLLAGAATQAPLRSALGPSRGLVTQAYLAALGAVVVGALLATLLLASWPPVAEAWGRLKPAHAWLNLVGFVSLVIATTLLHFLPTVTGSRIVTHWTGRATVLGVGAGAWLVAFGYAVANDLLARAGAAAALGGAMALAAYARQIWHRRFAWTTDRGWHAFAMGGLASAIGWFIVGVAIATARIIDHGADPAGWSANAVAAPLVAGWVGLALLASATHLIPAVGPGDQPIHARQRAVLGHWALARLIGLDVGVALLAAAGVTGRQDLAAAGGVVLGSSAVGTIGLLGYAVMRLRGRPAPA